MTDKLYTVWAEFVANNKEKVSTAHQAVYLNLIFEYGGQYPDKFEFKTKELMAKCSIKSRTTFIIILADLVSFEAIEILDKPKNQFLSACSKFGQLNSKIEFACSNIEQAIEIVEFGCSNIGQAIEIIEFGCSNIGQPKEIEPESLPYDDIGDGELWSLCQKYADKYDETLLHEFCRYWSQKADKAKKEFWQKQKAFEVGKRLSTWHGNQRPAYNQPKKTNEQILLQHLKNSLTKDGNNINTKSISREVVRFKFGQ